MRRIMLDKMIGFTVSLSLVLAGLTGCQSTKNVESGLTEVVQEKAHEPITILTGRQNYGDFVELLKEKHPEVNLEFVSFHCGDTSNYMLESLRNGDIPDIYTVTYVPDQTLQKENLLDLADYSVVNEYATTMLDSLSVNGNIYLLPSRYTLLGIVYNKTLMEENGWKVPQSFQELKELAPEIEASGYEVINMNSSLTGTTFGTFFALGNTNFFKTPEGAQWKNDFLKGETEAVGSLEPVTDYVQEWIDAGFFNTYYYDHPEENVNIDFDNRKYVFQLYSNRMLSEDTTDEYGFMPFLSEDGTNNMMVRLVSRYYGLNKELGEPGNEQKLEDAMKVLDLMATPEGQKALAGGNTTFISSASINELPEDSPYQDVLELINRGNMVDMVYGGWENHIVPLIENYGNDWINGKIDGADFLAGMDELNQEVLEGKGIEQIGVAQEQISLADTAKLCAIAEGRAADADVALISLPEFHGFADGINLENKVGVSCGIYQGNIMKTTVSMFAPGSDSILTVKLTGSEIKKLVQAGLMLEGDNTPFPYYMITKKGMELEDETEYILAVGNKELTDSSILEKAEDTDLTPKQAVIDFITELGTVTAESIVWE